ncbi:hypothetical protein E2C01_058522 [Portunus trituberculatus]|uniref:Uncharacterized protein n=1 Tax=Portunus trituberculatus TaxID=210409 RepID=A0A5B7H4X5_PORTR|nr:hypothetical protein [Portunus trituberculatus]
MFPVVGLFSGNLASPFLPEAVSFSSRQRPSSPLPLPAAYHHQSQYKERITVFFSAITCIPCPKGGSVGQGRITDRTNRNRIHCCGVVKRCV